MDFVGIRNYSSSPFLPPPAPYAPFRPIQHSIIHFPLKSPVSISQTDLRCHSGEFDPQALSSPSEFIFKDLSCDDDSTQTLNAGDLVRLEGEDDLSKMSSRGAKQMMKRSNLLAKQVISIQSALGLGFISQLWVDTSSWLVFVVEVKPSLLSGESDRFLLKDIVRVGDVVLVEEETVLENELNIIGLETLVGYRVVTPRGRSIGKVRSYTFNIGSGTIESLELDSFGISIIPSSLVSTYLLHVEDIIEVLRDLVVVHETAASRIQRLTKGLWDAQFVKEYSDVEHLERSRRRRQKRRDGRNNRSSRKKKREIANDEEEEEEEEEDGWSIFF